MGWKVKLPQDISIDVLSGQPCKFQNEEIRENGNLPEHSLRASIVSQVAQPYGSDYS